MVYSSQNREAKPIVFGFFMKQRNSKKKIVESIWGKSTIQGIKNRIKCLRRRKCYFFCFPEGFDFQFKLGILFGGIKLAIDGKTVVPFF